MRRALVVLVALAALALPAAAAAAAGGCPQTTVADLEDEVMCPVCGMPLGLAREAPQARRERALIARQIAACRSKDDIKAALVEEFGPAVLAEPPRGGFGAAAYVVPPIAGAIVLAGVVLALRRWRRAAELEPRL
jgi:cytochrome c-type biogenesis protein CcmH/NrfF